jgi:penicillin amidase
MLTGTLSRAMDQLAGAYGPDMSSGRWGPAHRAVFANPLWRELPLLGGLLQAALPVGGDASTVDAQAALSTPPFDAVHGASFRGVYDLADPDRSLFVIATGESGNPFSAHLLDLSRLWQRVGTVTIASGGHDDASRLLLSPSP